MRLLSLFSGTGALDAAVCAAFGATVVAHCEADAYCRQVLARHWPGVPCFEDVRTLTAADVGQIDIVCGGFPCTDLSVAGKQEGLQAARSGLWWEYLRLVTELRPSIVVIENVPPLYRKLVWRRQVQEPLEALGYRVIWTLCKASDVGAPHRRERAFALAWLPGVKVPVVPMPGLATALDGNPWPTPRREDSESTGAHRGRPDTLTSAARLWPTPTRQYDMVANGPNDHAGEYLRGAVLWATPTAADVMGGHLSRGGARKAELLLNGQVKEWATPAATEARQGYQRRHANAKGSQVSLTTQAVDASASAGVLNPAWVEPLCGLPIGYTEAAGDPMAVDPAPRWVAGRGPYQHDWEPPRTLPPKTGKDRRKRLMALGNIVVPQQALLALSWLSATANDATQCAFGGAQMRML